MFAILDKAKHDIENIRDLNLAVVSHFTVLVIKLPLQLELSLIRHNLLYEPGLKEASYMYCTYINYRYIMQ
jgi:hypothetical protein